MASIPTGDQTVAPHLVIPTYSGTAGIHCAARDAQKQWAAVSIGQRLRVVRRLRYLLALHAERVAATVPFDVPGSLHRNLADTLVAEVLPLAEACRFLERNAAKVLTQRRVSRRGRPSFLRGVEGVVERVPFGLVLVIGPSNYPLFLPSVQALQALVAGNAVLWKPAETGAAAANMVTHLLEEAGLPAHLVTVMDTTPNTAQDAIAAGVDKVVLTGRVSTGQAVLHSLAETVTPSVMELSGCDAVFLLPGADLEHAARAIAFALRLNNSATCMAPRRLFLVGSEHRSFEPLLLNALKILPPVALPPGTHAEMTALMDDAARGGARILMRPHPETGAGAVLIADAKPEMRCMQTDLAAPVLAIMQVPDAAAAQQAYAVCPYALTASVFGPQPVAKAFARNLRAGTLFINDVIVASADPRLPFGGRGHSGFGTTRGAEGLLEMTALRSVVTQHKPDPRNYMPTAEVHVPFFTAYIRAVHSSSWRQRLVAMRAFAAAARRIPSSQTARLRTGKR